MTSMPASRSACPTMSTPRSFPSSPGLQRKTLTCAAMRPLPGLRPPRRGFRAVLLADAPRYQLEDARVDVLQRQAGVEQEVRGHGALERAGQRGDRHRRVRLRAEDAHLLALVYHLAHLGEHLLLDLLNALPQ